MDLDSPETRQNLSKIALYVPCAPGQPSSLLPISELPFDIKSASLTVVFVHQVIYSPNANEKSLPSYVFGVFGIQPKQDTSENRENVPVSHHFRTKINGDVALILCKCKYDDTSKSLKFDKHASVEQDFSTEMLIRFSEQAKRCTPAVSYWASQGLNCWDRPLESYLYPYPTIYTNDMCKNWSPKQRVNELSVQLGTTIKYHPVTSSDVSPQFWKIMQTHDTKYSYKLIITEKGQGNSETDDDVYLPETGPFRTKQEAEVAAAIYFLQHYHTAYLKSCGLDVDQLSKAFGNALVTTGSSSKQSHYGPIPFDIQNPSFEKWNEIPESQHIPLADGNMMIKSILSRGTGLYLGVCTECDVFVSVLTYQDNEPTIIFSDMMRLTVGKEVDNLPIPIIALASMKLGESAYFFMKHDILSVDAKETILAIYLPQKTSITYSVENLVYSRVYSTITERISNSRDFERDAKMMYNLKQYKVALDHYMLAIRELIISNEALFPDRKEFLIMPENPDKDTLELKAHYIKMRTSAAAACLYLDSWMYLNPKWDCASGAVSEGLRHLKYALLLDKTNYLANKRRVLLLIKGKDFDTAEIELRSLSELSDAQPKDIETIRKQLDSERRASSAAEAVLAQKLIKPFA